jgi:hypothetical protein
VRVYPQLIPSVQCKRAELQYLRLAFGYHGIALGTAEPTTPTVSLTITSVPGVSGDALRELRYLAVLGFNLYNNSGATNTGYGKVVVDGVSIGSASYSFGSGYWSGFYAVFYVKPNSKVDIYAWASASGFTLEYVSLDIIVVPRIAKGFVKTVAVKIDGVVLGCPSASMASPLPPSIHLSHDDVPEASLSDVGAMKLSDAVMPSLYVAPVPLTARAATSSVATSTYKLLYPSLIAWAEVL